MKVIDGIIPQCLTLTNIGRNTEALVGSIMPLMKMTLDKTGVFL